MKRSPLVAAALALVSCAGLAVAQEKTAEKPVAKAPAEKAELKVGDPAPALSIEKWVKGEPISGFEKGKVYVVEFWATWCGPCIASMPHLSEIQAHNKASGLTVIGVTSKDKNGNTLEAVEKMVTAKGDKMAYTVAWDEGRETYAAYMDAAGRGSIPTSFVVDQDKRIVYIGHPMNLDDVIPKVLDKSWDPVKGLEAIEAKHAARRAEIKEITDAAAEDPAEGLKRLDAFEAKYPKDAKNMRSLRLRLLTKAGDTAGVKRIQNQIVDEQIQDKNAQGLNEIAWRIVDPQNTATDKDLDMAMRAAEAAVRFTESKDGAVLDTLARVHFLKGDLPKAIELQRKAVELVPEDQEDIKEELEQRLKEYEDAKS